MIMTLMKLVNSATKFRHGMDKFYQPNSGLRGSRSGDEAIYTILYIYNYYLSTYTIHMYCMYIVYIYNTKYSPNTTTFQGKVIIIHDFQTPADISQPASVTNLWPRPFLR